MRSQKAQAALWFYYVKPQAYALLLVSYAQPKGAYCSSLLILQGF
jgi:hypothetical protein